MKYILTIILILIPLIAYADEPRIQTIFTSANNKYELRLEEKVSKWVLREIETKKEIYKFKANRIESMTVLISDDGKSVIAIDDYSEQETKNNPEVLFFFRNGEKIKSYKLNDLISSDEFISYSVSHFSWLYMNKDSFKIENFGLTITTHELLNFSFNIETGEIIEKKRDELLSDDAIYGFGFVNEEANNDYTFSMECLIYGDLHQNPKVKFKSDSYKFIGGATNQTLIIKNGKLVKVLYIILNNCRNIKTENGQ